MCGRYVLYGPQSRYQEYFDTKYWPEFADRYNIAPTSVVPVIRQSPEGERHEYRGVVLEVEPGRRIVTTGAMTEGWVPQAGEMNFVRIDTFEPEGDGTRYTSRARHWDDKAMQTHAEMGFEPGWGAAADQLGEVAERLAAQERTP